VEGQPAHDPVVTEHLRQHLHIAQAILQRQHAAILGEHSLRRLGCRASVVAIDTDDNQIDPRHRVGISRRCHFSHKLPVQTLHHKAMLVYRLHVFRPYVYKRHLLADARQIGPVETPHIARADHRYMHCCVLPTNKCWFTPNVADGDRFLATLLAYRDRFLRDEPGTLQFDILSFVRSAHNLRGLLTKPPLGLRQ